MVSIEKPMMTPNHTPLFLAQFRNLSSDDPLVSRFDALREHIDLAVLVNTNTTDAREAYEVRGTTQVGAHFMIDFDGTIFQLTDVRRLVTRLPYRESNRAVIIALANAPIWRVGNPEAPAYPVDHKRAGELAKYPRTRLEGEIHGKRFAGWSFTQAQTRSLATLLRTLGRVFPAIASGPIRDAHGVIPLNDVDRSVALRGVAALYQLDNSYFDPGPALDWDALAPSWK